MNATYRNQRQGSAGEFRFKWASSNVQPCGGFTLLEVLVAVTVLGVLLVVLLNIVQSTTSLWRLTENRAEAFREARAGIQVMSSDLRNILQSTNVAFFPTNLTNTPHLAFFAAMPASAQNPESKGDLCTVGYFLAYGNRGPIAGERGRESYNLYRYFIESDETFTNLSSGADTFPDFGSPSSDRAEILARNIVSFDIAYFTVNGSALSPWEQSDISPLPNLVEIRFTAVNNERTMRFTPRGAAAEWSDFAAKTQDADYLKNTKTFTTRLKLNAP